MKITLLKKSEYSLFSTVVCLACFATNLSQMPFLVESALTQIVAIPVWVLLAAVCLMKDLRIRVGATLPVWCAAIIFLLYYLVAMMRKSSYSYSDLPYPIFLSMFILAVGLMAGRYLGAEDIRRIGNYYLVGGLIVCINVFFAYIYGNSIDGPSYLYASKNSVSQILLTTWILILLLKFNKKGIWGKLFWLAMMVFLTWTLLSLKSRATLIALPVLVLWYVFNGKLNKKVRNLILLMLIAVVLLMLFSDRFYDIVVNQVLFSGRDPTSTEAITSGRSTEWENFPRDFAQVWLLGGGRMKRESLILTALLEYGILGGGVILFLAVSPLLWSFKNLKKTHPQYLLFTSVAIAYLVNCIFEQMAPFGPGVKCYFLWFLFGLLENNKLTGCSENKVIDREGNTCES